ncbi:hypothetical protein [Acetivibrio mesophilus]|uniref:DUF4261 domain-containing protein n=1 Tax=Acetivibrio mesophilus TaxID=2487273 RepID=A0A4Q0I0N3_9FIRM|nr:hypothetical protein [Acetivibrio mesophilus]RXE57718.1 hypothetical protein EFD62_16170 [Acetivibrio mesophilus]
MHRNDEMSDRLSWEQHGYYIHLELVKESPNIVNYHTHGLLHSRGNPDFKITDPIDPFMAVSIFRELVELIDQGVGINPGMQIKDILTGLIIEISETNESDMLKITLSKSQLG